MVGVGGRDGVAAQRHLHQGQAQRPQVRGHAVLRPLQPLRGHVRSEKIEDIYGTVRTELFTTLRYAATHLVPTKLFAMESINCPDTPKSQIFISP